MALLPDLPVELILHIAAFVVTGRTYLRTLSSLARANRRLHAVLNPVLYKHNLFCSSPTRSCILWGARHGSLPTVKLGYQHGGSLNLDISDTNWPPVGAVRDWGSDTWTYQTQCGTALQLSLRNSHLDIVAYLLEHGVDVHAPSLACCHCRGLGRLSYPLHEVVCDVPRDLRHHRDPERDRAAALLLIRRGAYLHAPDRPALQQLVRRGMLDLVAALLERPGTDAGAAGPDGETALHVAAECGHADIVRLLLNRPEVDADPSAFGMRTPAELAARCGHVGILRLLLDRSGGDRRSSARAFYAAIDSGHTDVVRVLLDDYGARPSDADP